MTIGHGPCCKASGHSGSKTAKTTPTSMLKMAKWGPIFWPKMVSILILIYKKIFWAWFQSGTSQWRVLAALRKRVIFFSCHFLHWNFPDGFKSHKCDQYVKIFVSSQIFICHFENLGKGIMGPHSQQNRFLLVWPIK